MESYNNPERLVELVSAQFKLRICGCYDVAASESICLQKKGKEFSVSDIEAYIDVMMLSDCEEEEEYLVSIEYGADGFLAIKKIDEDLFLYLASEDNVFPHVLLFLNNLEAMTEMSVSDEDIVISETKEAVSTTRNDENLKAAKQIQDLVLSDEKILDKYFKSHFLYFKPQEIIGGDFYTFIELDDVLYIIVADCTGHSVEGALATMAVSSIIKEVITSATLEVSTIIQQIYERVDSYNENRKDMDSYGLGVEIGLCKVDKEMKQINFASSGVLLIHQSEEGQKISRIKKGFDKREYYVDKFPIQKGDSVILFSDGIPDQFDQKDEQKLGKRNLRKIVDSSYKSGDQKEQTFVSQLNNWKGSTPALDDQTLLWLTV